MSKLKFGIKFFIFLTLPLFLIALPSNSYASFLFSDNFASPTVQKLDVYNSSYHNLQTADNDGGTVYNGKMYLNGQSGTPNDYYTYTGLGSVSNLCSIVTGVPEDGELGVQLLGSPTNVFHGEVDYGIYGSSTAFSGHARLYLNGNPSDLGPINIDFTQSHIISVCENGNQIIFTVDNNVIDQRTIAFTPTWPGFSIFSTNAYITNYSVGQAPTLATAINAGGDTAGNFAQDTYYNGGSTFTTSTSVDTSNVSNPAPGAVYQSL